MWDEQRLAELSLEQGQLAADGLDRDPQPVCGAGDAAFLGDDPEVVQVLVVEVLHFIFVKTLCFLILLLFLLFVQSVRITPLLFFWRSR